MSLLFMLLCTSSSEKGGISPGLADPGAGDIRASCSGCCWYIVCLAVLALRAVGLPAAMFALRPSAPPPVWWSMLLRTGLCDVSMFIFLRVFVYCGEYLCDSELMSCTTVTPSADVRS